MNKLYNYQVETNFIM